MKLQTLSLLQCNKETQRISLSLSQSCGFSEEKDHHSRPLSSLFLALILLLSHSPAVKLSQMQNTDICSLSVITLGSFPKLGCVTLDMNAVKDVLNNARTHSHLQHYLYLLLNC